MARAKRTIETRNVLSLKREERRKKRDDLF